VNLPHVVVLPMAFFRMSGTVSISAEPPRGAPLAGEVGLLGGRQRIEVDMPAAMVDTELIKDAVRSACRAPSLHNSQPWHWVARRGQLELFLGLGRAMVSDRSGREARSSSPVAKQPPGTADLQRDESLLDLRLAGGSAADYALRLGDSARPSRRYTWQRWRQ